MANYLIGLSKQERGYGTDPNSPAYVVLNSSDRNGDIDESTLNPDIHINTFDSLSFMFDPDAGDNFPSIHPVEFSHSDSYEWDVNGQNVTTTTWYGTHNGETNSTYFYGNFRSTTYHYAGEYYYRSKNDPSNVVGRIIVSEPSSSSSSSESSSSSSGTTTTTPPVEDYSDCIPGRLLVGFSDYGTIDSITALGYGFVLTFDTTPLTGGLFTFDANSKTVATAIAEVKALDGVTYAECDTTVTTTVTTPPAENPDPAEPTTSENTLPKTTLTSGVSENATVLPVASTTGFAAGDTIIIDKGTNVEETGVIASISSIVLTEGLQYAHAANASVEKMEVVDCSTIPQNCRTTIDELTDATTSEDTDEFIVSRGGEAFKVSMSEIMSKIIDGLPQSSEGSSEGSGNPNIKAFVSFDGTDLTIHKSYNVSSIYEYFDETTPRGEWGGSEAGVGHYQVNFTTPIEGKYSVSYNGSFTENAIMGAKGVNIDLGGNGRKCDHCICGVHQNYVQFASYGSYSSGPVRQKICNIIVVG